MLRRSHLVLLFPHLGRSVLGAVQQKEHEGQPEGQQDVEHNISSSASDKVLELQMEGKLPLLGMLQQLSRCNFQSTNRLAREGLPLTRELGRIARREVTSLTDVADDPPYLREHPEIVLEAFLNGACEWKDVPSQLKEDPSFFTSALRRTANVNRNGIRLQVRPALLKIMQNSAKPEELVPKNLWPTFYMEILRHNQKNREIFTLATNQDRQREVGGQGAAQVEAWKIIVHPAIPNWQSYSWKDVPAKMRAHPAVIEVATKNIRELLSSNYDDRTSFDLFESLLKSGIDLDPSFRGSARTPPALLFAAVTLPSNVDQGEHGAATQYYKYLEWLLEKVLQWNSYVRLDLWPKIVDFALEHDHLFAMEHSTTKADYSQSRGHLLQRMLIGFEAFLKLSGYNAAAPEDELLWPRGAGLSAQQQKDLRALRRSDDLQEDDPAAAGYLPDLALKILKAAFQHPEVLREMNDSEFPAILKSYDTLPPQLRNNCELCALALVGSKVTTNALTLSSWGEKVPNACRENPEVIAAAVSVGIIPVDKGLFESMIKNKVPSINGVILLAAAKVEAIHERRGSKYHPHLEFLLGNIHKLNPDAAHSRGLQLHPGLVDLWPALVDYALKNDTEKGHLLMWMLVGLEHFVELEKSYKNCPGCALKIVKEAFRRPLFFSALEKFPPILNSYTSLPSHLRDDPELCALAIDAWNVPEVRHLALLSWEDVSLPCRKDQRVIKAALTQAATYVAVSQMSQEPTFVYKEAAGPRARTDKPGFSFYRFFQETISTNSWEGLTLTLHDEEQAETNVDIIKLDPDSEQTCVEALKVGIIPDYPSAPRECQQYPAVLREGIFLEERQRKSQKLAPSVSTGTVMAGAMRPIIWSLHVPEPLRSDEMLRRQAVATGIQMHDNEMIYEDQVSAASAMKVDAEQGPASSSKRRTKGSRSASPSMKKLKGDRVKPNSKSKENQGTNPQTGLPRQTSRSNFLARTSGHSVTSVSASSG
ncbi:unnamed protein product [Amoebophrya sp. A25]|nr:unnamed protein product [Amoebophrya sp. A25]|eukprot:GSA25T00021789001.1